jgi:polysaccharide export outer membrane protein
MTNLARFRAAVALVLLLALAACQPPRSQELAFGDTTPTYLDQLTPEERDAAARIMVEQLRRGTNAYQLQPGDKVEVLFIVNNQRLRPYRIGIRDELDIEYQFDPSLNRLAVVRPDGMITLPGRGEIMAMGQRPVDLARKIAARYADVARAPEVTVAVRKFVAATDELTEVVQNGAEGRARSAVVRPDGMLDMPMLAGVRAAGLTPEDLQEELDRRYATAVGGIRTSVRLTAMGANQIFVYGEVKAPGAVPAPTPRTLLQTVAAAGGPLPTGAMDQVRVLYFDPVGRARVRQVNLEKVMSELRISDDLVVPPNSTVFVPPTQLAKVGRFVDQLFRQTFLYNGLSIAIDPYLAATRGY